MPRTPQNASGGASGPRRSTPWGPENDEGPRTRGPSGQAPALGRLCRGYLTIVTVLASSSCSPSALVTTARKETGSFLDFFT